MGNNLSNFKLFFHRYEIEKERLLNLIQEQKEKEKYINQHNIFKCDVMLKIRIALQRIEEMCSVVHDTVRENKRAKILGHVPSTYSIIHDNGIFISYVYCCNFHKEFVLIASHLQLM